MPSRHPDNSNKLTMMMETFILTEIKCAMRVESFRDDPSFRG
jgi:hypothetical protein